MKKETRFKHVVKFLNNKRELYYDLRDANETFEFANAQIENKKDLSDHKLG